MDIVYKIELVYIKLKNIQKYGIINISELLFEKQIYGRGVRL